MALEGFEMELQPLLSAVQFSWGLACLIFDGGSGELGHCGHITR